jgi:signal transduction histidine kinase
MDVLGQSSLLVAITSFAIGSAVLARNVRNKLFLMFAILTTVISGWALFFFLAKLYDSEFFYKIHLLMNIWMAPAGLAFIRSMVKMEDRLSRWILGAAIAGASLLSIALGFHYERIPVVLQIVYFFPGMVVLQILQLMWLDLRHQRQGHSPPRRNLIYFGGLFVLALSSLDHAPWMGPVMPSVGNLALTVYVFFLSQAVSRQRLLNFGALFSRFLVLLTIAFTLTIVYSIIFAYIEHNTAIFFLNSFIVSFLLLMLLEPIRTMVGYLTRRLLTQKYRRLEETLRQSQRHLVGITDPATFFQSVLNTVELTLQPEWCALYVLRPDGTRYRRVRMVGTVRERDEERASLREILVTHPMLDHCRRTHQKGDLPVLLDQFLQNEIDRSASRKQRDYLSGLIQGLRALHANLLIPLFDQETILGFVVLAVSSPPEPWGNNWGLLPQIYPYFEQAAETMRSLEIFVRQREKERLAALGEMAAGLAHEIRNPLGAIKGAAQFLEPNPGAETRPESRFLKIIIEETDRLNRVVTQFLDYSKPAALDLRPVELKPLVEKTVDKMRPAIPADITLQLESELGDGNVTQINTQIMAQPEQIQQVLINLIQNSVRAIENRGSSPREKMIRVRVEGGGAGEFSEAVVSVEDTGHGIKKENLDKLFIPFFTTTPSGTGLGLSISQKIIEAHRGRIEVASEEGRFTRFSVILPVVTKAHEAKSGELGRAR